MRCHGDNVSPVSVPFRCVLWVSAGVMNDPDNPGQRQEVWHEDDHEYYARLHVTLIGAGMENYPIFLGTVYWTISRSSYGRGRFSVRFVPAS